MLKRINQNYKITAKIIMLEMLSTARHKTKNVWNDNYSRVLSMEVNGRIYKLYHLFYLSEQIKPKTFIAEENLLKYDQE